VGGLFVVGAISEKARKLSELFPKNPKTVGAISEKGPKTVGAISEQPESCRSYLRKTRKLAELFRKSQQAVGAISEKPESYLSYSRNTRKQSELFPKHQTVIGAMSDLSPNNQQAIGTISEDETASGLFPKTRNMSELLFREPESCRSYFRNTRKLSERFPKEKAISGTPKIRRAIVVET
jgi:hypothetical protein